MRNKSRLKIPTCPECSSSHEPSEVKMVNIEEDIHGNDLLTYICPVTKEQAKSNVYRVR